jgi:hypothetical protein
MPDAGNTRGLDVAGVGDEMHQARLDGNGGLAAPGLARSYRQ